MGDRSRVSHGMRHYNLCRAVAGTKLGMALDDIKAAGADPEMLRIGEALIDEGRQLIIIANDRVGDGNRECARIRWATAEDFASCRLKYNHAGECDYD